MAKVFKVLGLGFLAAFVITLGWLTVAPPDLIRVATNYSAKIVCSNVFLAGRRADTVMEVDVQAPGHPILGFISTSVDRPSGEVRSRLLGLFALGRAVHRPGLGCANVPNGGDRPALTGLTVEDVPAPAPLETALAAALEPVLADKDLLGSGWRAVVVLQDGKIIGERYADGVQQAGLHIGDTVFRGGEKGLQIGRQGHGCAGRVVENIPDLRHQSGPAACHGGGDR
ncbi:MAG: hypothetical protein AAFQ50_17170, partial [Pseudomonadota bacterium]